MSNSQKRVDGRTLDFTFRWLLTSLGPEWHQWQQFAAEWMAKQDKGADARRRALAQFFERYLLKTAPYAIDVAAFFKGYNGHICSSDEFIEILKNGKSLERHHSLSCNYIQEFIDWLIEKHFSEPDDRGTSQPLVSNPFTRTKGKSARHETVRNPLPYRFIQDLRQILCPLPKASPNATVKGAEKKPIDTGEKLDYTMVNFRDWVFAQGVSGNGRGPQGDWFEVPPDSINKNDSDCVWRTKSVFRGGTKNKVKVYQLWSPVRAMVVYTKLHLPLRTYQVRMLDSGEADTWRYKNGQWKLNTANDFALGNEKRPYGKGVFKRIFDTMGQSYSTGLYINTNKTADQNKEEFFKGYTIPWQHDELLYWLEKLRNWQEKYNPISQPTSCTTLEPKHTNGKKSDKALREMGEISFLFRNPACKDNDRVKPVADAIIKPFWYILLKKLEDDLFIKGETLENGERLKLVPDYDDNVHIARRAGAHFPMHALRVSLITAYTMETELPLPVISKLLAGHSRLLATIYYNKITPSMMAEKMDVAHGLLKQNEGKSVKGFLKDASLEQIKCKMIYHSEDSVGAALVNRNPIGWEERACGMCLVGGNTVKSDEMSTLGGCWNGGELLNDAKTPSSRIYGAVPHGPENCIRCRWFITEARYLPVLNAQLNQLSYKAHEAGNFSIEIEEELEALRDEQFFAEEQGRPFIQQVKLQALQRRYEKQQVDANEYAKDFIHCFELINRILCIEEERIDDDTKDKLIAVGSKKDVSQSLRFLETESELLHLSLLCEDAEFYPDLQDELRKTPVIEKRSRQINRMMMKKGFEPIFMEMDDKQQMIAGNAMLRQMAKIADPNDKLEGFRKVANYIEAGEYLQDHKLLNVGLNELLNKAVYLERITLSDVLEK